MEDNENKIYTGPKISSGNPGVMAAGCIIPVNPNNLQYEIYSAFSNSDYIYSMEVFGSRFNGPSLRIHFKNVRNKNDYIYLMQCTPSLVANSVSNEHFLACSYYAHGEDSNRVIYDFYMYDTNNGANIVTDSYYTFFLPCIE